MARTRKPVIGVTPMGVDQAYEGTGTLRVYGAYPMMTRAVEAAGGVPLVIPAPYDDVDDLLAAVDGLLLTGGDDIDPVHYDDERHAALTATDPVRDELELRLVRRAVEEDVPMLCICRGIQLLNVALGGTLVQDIPTQYPTEILHDQSASATPMTEPQHVVTVSPDSLLARTYGCTTIAVNSFHHQALRDLAPGLVVDAVAPDEVVEAVARPASGWLLGVQWHPEMMYEAHSEHLAPFRALVDQARQRRDSRG